MRACLTLLPRARAITVRTSSSLCTLPRSLQAALARAYSPSAAAPPAPRLCPCCFGAVHKMSSHTSDAEGSRAYSSSSSGGGLSVVSLILQEHRLVENLFKQYHEASDPEVKQHKAWMLIKEISSHGAKEEMSIYPWMKKHLPETTHDIDHGLKEHQTLKEDLAALDKLTVADPKFDETIQRCWKDLAHHIKEEETDILPALEKKATAAELLDLANTFQKVETIAPTRPHPHAPAEGVAAVMANAGATVVDKMRDAARFSDNDKKYSNEHKQA